jgi:hypothetical protein
MWSTPPNSAVAKKRSVIDIAPATRGQDNVLFAKHRHVEVKEWLSPSAPVTAQVERRSVGLRYIVGAQCRL